MTEEPHTSLALDGPVAILTMQPRPHNLLGPALMSGIPDDLARAEQAGARAVLLKSGLRRG